MDNNLLKSNFIGRDGFRWWIGQVAPEEAQGDQLNQIGSTWGCRLKVRIMGYHPQNTVELEDDDLPWAQVLLSSQCGSGKANRARSIRIAPGDTVLGFFLDGDDAQLPVILGIFGNTNYSPSDEYAGPFKPFTGYTSKIKPNNEFIAKNESGDDSSNSQKSPRFLTNEIVEDLNKATEEGKVQVEQIVNSQELQNATSEVSSELEGFISGAASQTGIKGNAQNSRELVESLKKKYAYSDTQAYKGIGQEIILGSGKQAADNNTKSTSKVKNVLKNKLSTIKNGVPQEKFKGLSEGASEIVSASKPMIKDMVNTTFDELAPQLNGGLNKLYKDKFGEVMGKTGDLSLAKKAAQAAQVAMVGPVMSLQNAMPCAVKNITDKLTGDVLNLLAEFTNNVDNFTECIGDQFIGALFNDIIKGINNELSDVIGGVANIFPGGDIEGLLRSKAEGLLGIASIFDDCDIPTTDLGSKTNKWVLGVGPSNLNLENIADKVLQIANAAQSLREASASPGGIIGNLGLFDFMRPDVSTPGFSSALSDCYTGPPLNCSGIKINLFGGGGQGAQVNPILGAIVNDTFAVQTASLIGMKVINAGSGYKSPPFVEIEDTCRKGYGAVARAVIDYDPSSPTYQQLTDVYVVSSGENYPVIEPEEGDDGVYTVDHVVVVKPGKNYKQEDTVIDDKGNVYEKLLDEQGRILNVIPPDPSINNVEPFSTLPELEIISSTGIGALLKAQLAPRPTYQGKVRQVIDCISPRNTEIVGFINGEPYYGPFHVHPTTGAKMVGVAHTTAPHAIIYDTPQESRTSRSPVISSTSYTTVSSAQVQTNVSDTTTTSQPDTSSIPQTDPVDTSSQQTSGQSYTPPPSSPPSGGGSSGSGGGSSGG
ncbi:MAG: hypothetical protein CMG35_10900, partial [Candidatus Marinimicrobia bacterium]|nr:hypothetical protein [Candidatus Neomarinimicrobiota bacterium]